MVFTSREKAFCVLGYDQTNSHKIVQRAFMRWFMFPPLPANVNELKQRITIAQETVTQHMLHRVWEELDYRLEVCQVTGGTHTEHFKIFYGIHVPLNFLFKFIGINIVLVNIKPVEYHLIRLCSFCNIDMSNFLKHHVMCNTKMCIKTFWVIFTQIYFFLPLPLKPFEHTRI